MAWESRSRGQYEVTPGDDVRDRYSSSPGALIWSDAHLRLLAAGVPVWEHSPHPAKALEVEPRQLSPWLLKSYQERVQSIGFATSENYKKQDLLPAFDLSASWPAPALAVSVPPGALENPSEGLLKDPRNRNQEQLMDDDECESAEDRLYEALRTLRANNALLSRGLVAMEMSLHELEVTQGRLMAEIQRMRSAKDEEPSPHDAEPKQQRCVLCGANTERMARTGPPATSEPLGPHFGRTGFDGPESRNHARSCSEQAQEAEVIG